MAAETLRSPDSPAEVLREPAAREERLLDLLEKTSRTFALSIPVLPEPTRMEVAIAYLLFRIADTFEDGEAWPRARKIEALEELGRLLDHPDPEAARRATAGWLDGPPVEHPGYLELLSEVPLVLDAFFALRPGARELVGEHTLRTARGMAGFVERTDEAGILQLRDLPDLQEYCYVVAGIVGEMLTGLFLLERRELEPIAPSLDQRARRFGEALQLVNILKDSASDARFGRNYLPEDGDRSEVFALARGDLEAAGEYVRALQEGGAPRGIVAFTALPVLLAWASLERVEEVGPGAKLTRPEVFALVQRLEAALDAGEPAV